ncbi:hypothetical protein [Tianweitania sp.]|uniref:hypothetical protein n=1 Tax=Tianweitania sp. TaxID=2021634 RepID=UPI00289B257F|nr:hypothetical protein [Tianweitania sp.]
MRHMPFDPFALIFSRLLHNRISVHHSKEMSELILIRSGLRGLIASKIESITGQTAIMQAAAIIGVTEEIATYEMHRADRAKASCVYPNAIKASSVKLLPDRRDRETVNVAFICGTFSEWHGLERLFSAVREYPDNSIEDKLRIYLIGNLFGHQRQAIIQNARLKSIFQPLGHMPEAAYRPILERCDLGLTSFALDLKDLREAATLKVREMLAMGLPVYAGHKDTALSNDFPYYVNDRIINVDSLLSFAKRMKAVSRDTVRSSAEPFIDKVKAMDHVAAFCRQHFNI